MYSKSSIFKIREPLKKEEEEEEEEAAVDCQNNFKLEERMARVWL